VILGGGVAVCLLLSAHHTVIFAIAQLSCFSFRVLSDRQTDRHTHKVTDVTDHPSNASVTADLGNN